MDEQLSILNSIKKMLNIDESDSDFDTDIIIHINSVFLILSQLGVSEDSVFSISDSESTWDQYIPDNNKLLNYVKSYVYYKVKLVFDPPSSQILIQILKDQANECEWRIVHELEKGENQNG